MLFLVTFKIVRMTTFETWLLLKRKQFTSPHKPLIMQKSLYKITICLIVASNNVKLTKNNIFHVYNDQ